MKVRFTALLCAGLLLCLAAGAASLPRDPRLASTAQGKLLGGYQIAPGPEGEFELFANRDDGGGIASLGRYSGQLAGVAVGRYDGRLYGLTRDGTLTAYGDDPEMLAQGDARWNLVDFIWDSDGPLALDYSGDTLTLVRLDAEKKTWRADASPIVRDARVAKAVLAPLDNELHLFWSARARDLSRGAIRHMIFRDGVWSDSAPLPLGDVQSFTAFQQGDGMILAAVAPPALGADGPNRMIVKVWYDGSWLPNHPLADSVIERLTSGLDLAGAWTENHIHWLSTGVDGVYLISPHAGTTNDTAFTLVQGDAGGQEEMRLAAGGESEFAWSGLASLFFLVLLIVVVVFYCRRSRMLSAVLPGRPPDLTSRAVAVAIDWLLVSIALSAYHIAVGDMRIYFELITFGEVNRMFWLNLGALALFITVGEAWFGQSPGKWLTGIRVRSVLGGPPVFLQTVLRNLCRALDMFPLIFPGLIGAVVTFFNPRRQRIGDMVGATVVLRHAPLERRAFILASASPRRLELIRALGLDATPLPSNIDEDAIRGETPEETVRLLAEAKAKAAAGKVTRASEIILAADTVVVLDGEVLGKPGDAREAKAMLQRLSGRSHQVLTGVSVWDSATGQGLSDVESTEVEFRLLSDREIDDYVATGDPLDKAGAYGVQTGFLVKEVRGSLSNVAGLPMEMLQGLLAMLDS